MAIEIRFQGIVDTLVNIATDKFKGRLAWATNIARMIWYYDANNYGEMARRDVLETFAQGIQDSTGTSGRVVRYGASGRLQGDAGLTTTQTGGITRLVTLGDGSVAANAAMRVRRTATYRAAYELMNEGGFSRWDFRLVGGSDNLSIVARDAAGNDIDAILEAPNAAGSAIVLGGAGATKRPLRSTGGIQDVNSVQRMSAAGAATMASLQASNLSGTGTRPLVADASGNIDDQDAATFRATIGALGTTGAVSQLLKAQTNNAWSNTGPSTQIFHSYQAVYWDGCKLFSADGVTEYGTFNGGSSSTGKASSTPSLSAYPAVTLSGADLQIQRDLAAYLGTLAKPTFLGSGTKFGDGGGVLLFPRVGASSAFPGIATGYGNAPISGGGALVASFVDDDADTDNTTAPATWNTSEFRTNATLSVGGGRSEGAGFVAEASTGFSGNQTISYTTLESRWVYTGTGGHTITLPTSGAGGGNLAPTSFVFRVAHTGTGLLTVAVGHASHSIDGVASLILGPGQSVTLAATSTTRWSTVGAAAKGRSFACIYKTGADAAQSIPTGSTYTKITPFDTNLAGAVVSTADAANDRIIAGRTGVYQVDFVRSYTVGTANAVWRVAVFVNGVIAQQTEQITKAVSINTETYACLAAQINANAGDAIDVRVYHDQGGNVNLTYQRACLSITAID